MTLIRARGPTPAAVATTAAAARQADAPIPLTHHEIMALVGPFVRRGRSVDLSACDRAQRRVVFKPIVHPAADGPAPAGEARADASGTPELPSLTESLILDHPGDDRFRLERRLLLPDGLQASLVCYGADPGALLAGVLGVPLDRQVRLLCRAPAAADAPTAASPPPAPVWAVLSHSLVPDSGRLTLTEARCRVVGLELAMTVSRVKGIPADATLTPLDGRPLALPQDLLAVLGLPWSRLSRTFGSAAPAWRATIALRGFDSERTRDAEEKLQRTAQHLAETLSRPPAQFHARFRRARWLVVLRRLTPLLVALGLIAAALLVPQLDLGPDSVLRMLIFNSPPLLLAALFCMRELPRIEIPPWPRPSDQPHWSAGAPP